MTVLALAGSFVPALAVYFIVARVIGCEEATLVQRRFGELAGRFSRS